MIMMPTRRLEAYEQPHRAIAGLQMATRVRTMDEIVPLRTASSAPRRRQQEDKTMGVPHGVMNAFVKARRVQLKHVDSEALMYFCESYGYLVLEDSLSDADGGEYPAANDTFISFGCLAPPQDGLYDIDVRVSLNGSVHLHVVRFDRHISTQETAGV